MQKFTYETPELELLSVTAELGFAASAEVGEITPSPGDIPEDL